MKRIISYMKALFAQKNIKFFIVFVLTLIVIFGIGDGSSNTESIVVGSDTLQVKQNIWTGNYKVTDKKGNEYQVDKYEIHAFASNYQANNF